MTEHRVVPRSLSLDEEREEANAYRCANCGATRRFPDEFDDFACNAEPML